MRFEMFVLRSRNQTVGSLEIDHFLTLSDSRAFSAMSTFVTNNPLSACCSTHLVVLFRQTGTLTVVCLFVEGTGRFWRRKYKSINQSINQTIKAMRTYFSHLRNARFWNILFLGEFRDRSFPVRAPVNNTFRFSWLVNNSRHFNKHWSIKSSNLSTGMMWLQHS